mmetsp:Transcript_54382/g.158745  ORF Transcript_54382/g.158745 Transcript_54382/m.158745 type:complete len:307 (+) Transcript_54382:190-1110(+)
MHPLPLPFGEYPGSFPGQSAPLGKGGPGGGGASTSPCSGALGWGGAGSCLAVVAVVQQPPPPPAALDFGVVQSTSSLPMPPATASCTAPEATALGGSGSITRGVWLASMATASSPGLAGGLGGGGRQLPTALEIVAGASASAGGVGSPGLGIGCHPPGAAFEVDLHSEVSISPCRASGGGSMPGKPGVPGSGGTFAGTIFGRAFFGAADTGTGRGNPSRCCPGKGGRFRSSSVPPQALATMGGGAISGGVMPGVGIGAVDIWDGASCGAAMCDATMGDGASCAAGICEADARERDICGAVICCLAI